LQKLAFFLAQFFQEAETTCKLRLEHRRSPTASVLAVKREKLFFPLKLLKINQKVPKTG
jgi:hypothetical protein